ncbi:unnamed protein product [Effrenium voratum]|nr:unnamed protein product [Effrenium voratum]
MFFLRSCPLLRNGCRGQDRDHAHHSNLWQWPVKELKARLEALGADLKGVTEKTELVNLLEQPLGCIMPDRDHAHHSNLWQWPVKELKARLEALGADLKGVTEKTELVNLLEQPLGCIMQKAALCEFAHGAGIEAMPSPPNPEEPFAHLEEDDCHSLKRPRGPLPSPTPEARDHARHSELWDLPVKELKARLRAIGADFTGLAEKTELIMLLERSVELRRKEYLHTENIPTFVL